MKGFHRTDPFFSLCGLNCGLCPMHLGGHCPGCGFGSQSCKIARCSLDHGGVEYCYQCPEYPCSQYDGMDEFDSFITHQRRTADMERAKQLGPAAYQAEQQQKIQILNTFLSDYNDGRHKTFYCVAVNLLEVHELENVLRTLQASPLAALTRKGKAADAAQLLQSLADQKHLILKLRKRR